MQTGALTLFFDPARTEASVACRCKAEIVVEAVGDAEGLDEDLQASREGHEGCRLHLPYRHTHLACLAHS